MPFKKSAARTFIGRTAEIEYFRESILKAAAPDRNIISISGESGVGKSELLEHFLEITRGAEFKDSCIAALVDEADLTLDFILERFAGQLHLDGKLKKSLDDYRTVLLNLQSDRETAREVSLAKGAEIVGAVAESALPVGGSLVKIGATAGADAFSSWNRPRQQLKGYERRKNAISDVTRAFVEAINDLAKRGRRIILVFDNFERLAPIAVPWLLDHFLEADINSNVVLVVAGRERIERSTPDSFKQWLPYINDDTIYWMPLSSFSQEETITFLKQRNITDPERTAKVWQLSQGLPLFLAMLSANAGGEIDLTETVLHNFLQAIPPDEYDKQQLSLGSAQFSRPFNRDDLDAFKLLPKELAFLPEDKKTFITLFQWLTGQEFVRKNPRDGRHSYQNLVRELFTRHHSQDSPKEYEAIRKAMANYYQQQLDQLQAEGRDNASDADGWLELIQALAYQLLLLPDEASHRKAIELILLAYHKTGQAEAAGKLQELTQGRISELATPDARETASQLISYIESDLGSEPLLESASFLLAKSTHKTAFAPELLIHLYRNRGLTYLLLNRYQEASDDLRRALELAPDDVWMHANCGLVAINLGESRQAIADFDQALQLSPGEAEIYAMRGLAYIAVGDITLAIQDLDYALSLNPDDKTPYALKGIASLFLSEFQQAIEDFNRALAANPNLFWAYSLRGTAYLSLHEAQRAIDDLNYCLALAPGYVWAYISRGQAYALLHEAQPALDDLNYALELVPNLAQAYAGRGFAYALLNQPQQAIQDCNQAIKLMPSLAHAYIGRGRAYLTLYQLQQAIDDFNRALQIAPFAFVYANRGTAYLALFQLPQAIEDFNRALELAPNLAIAYSGRGMAYALTGELEQAMQDCNQALTLDPGDATAYYYRGSVSLTMQNAQAAIEDMNQVLRLNPDMAQAYASRGVAYALLGQPQLALDDCNKALEILPDYPDPLLGRGVAYMSLEAYQQAIDDFNRFLAVMPASASVYQTLVYYFCSACSIQLKEYQQAIESLDRLIELSSTSEAYSSRGDCYLWLKKIEQAGADFASSWELDHTSVFAGLMTVWCEMCRQKPDAEVAQRLEAVAAEKPERVLAYVCLAIAQWLQGNGEAARAELEEDIEAQPDSSYAYFWKGLVCASLGQEEAQAMIEKALELEMPPVLLLPLRWLEQDSEAYYEKYVAPLLSELE
jgi:tetratricopeptide (TPR) repeat protein